LVPNLEINTMIEIDLSRK